MLSTKVEIFYIEKTLMFYQEQEIYKSRNLLYRKNPLKEFAAITSTKVEIFYIEKTQCRVYQVYRSTKVEIFYIEKTVSPLSGTSDLQK